ncbi:MAG: serpin family protein [Polyangiales bacterium]
MTHRAAILNAHRSFALLAFVAAGALAGCGGSVSPSGGTTDVTRSALPRNTAPATATGAVTTLVSDNTDFAGDLYRQVAAAPSNANANVFVSPYSVSLALAMTYAGARGATHDQMAKALHFSLPDAQLHATFDAVDLLVEAPPIAASDGTTSFQLALADALFLDKQFNVAAPFLDTLATNYGAGTNRLDFENAPDASRLAINDWTAAQTNDRIQNLLPNGSITPLTRFVLVNAIYFKAGWAAPFDPKVTQAATFRAADGSTPSVQMMGAESEYKYAETADLQLLELPYTGNASMVVLLPGAGKLASVEASLSAATLSAALGAASFQQVNVSLPKFSIKGPTFSLMTTLKALGMTDAFDPNLADFSALTADGSKTVSIADVLHQAFVAVDESGTEAAAATAVIGVGSVAFNPNPKTFTADHPFLFVIRDTTTGSILFEGRVANPS